MRPWFLALFAAIIIAACQMGQESLANSPPRRSALELHIDNQKNLFILKEALVFSIRIGNKGNSPLQVPEIADSRNVSLAYALEGPSAPGGITFNYGISAGFRLPGGPEMRTLAPGETMEESVDILNHLSAWKVGKHSIRIRLNNVVSEPFAFTIEAARVKSAQVLSDGAHLRPGMMRIAFLNAGGQVYQGFCSEPNGLDPTPPTSRLIPAVAAPADAESVLVPQTNFDRASIFFSRFGWVGKSSLGIEESPAAPSAQLALQGETVLRPALMTQSGEVSVFLLKNRELSLAHIPRPKDGPPQRVWSVALPGDGLSGASTLGPVAAGSPCSAVVLIPHQDAMSIAVARNGKVRSQRFEKLYPLPNSTPAIHVDADGMMRTSVLVSDSAERKRVLVLDLLWIEGEALAEEKRSGPFPLPGKVAGGVVVFGPQGSPPRRDWALALEDGGVISHRDPNTPKRYGTGPVFPMQLAARARESYLLSHDQTHVLWLYLL